MNVVSASVSFQRCAMETVNHAAEIFMQVWAQLFGNQRQSVLRSVDDVIDQIRIRHVESVAHESRLFGYLRCCG